MHARRKGIRTTTVDLAEIAHSSVSGDLSTKSSKQVNHAPEEGTNGPHNLCRAASLSAARRGEWAWHPTLTFLVSEKFVYNYKMLDS